MVVDNRTFFVLKEVYKELNKFDTIQSILTLTGKNGAKTMLDALVQK